MAYFNYQKNKLISRVGKDSEFKHTIFLSRQSLLRGKSWNLSLQGGKATPKNSESQKVTQDKPSYLGRTGFQLTKREKIDHYIGNNRERKTGFIKICASTSVGTSNVNQSLTEKKTPSEFIAGKRKMSMVEMKRRHTNITNTINSAKRKLDQDIHNEIFKIFEDKKRTKTLISGSIGHKAPVRRMTVINYM